MNQEAEISIVAARKSVTRLIQECRKGGSLYSRRPKEVAQVNRTSKWLLNALDRLQRTLAASSDLSAA